MYYPYRPFYKSTHLHLNRPQMQSTLNQKPEKPIIFFIVRTAQIVFKYFKSLSLILASSFYMASSLEFMLSVRAEH